MKKLSPLAYVPRRGTLQTASLVPVGLFLGSYLVICFLSSDPVVLVLATIGAAIAGFGCRADRAVWFSLRLGLVLAISMVVINVLVTSRGATVLARLGDWPILGQVNVTLESFAAGGVIGLRVLGTMVVIGVYSACVDPDRILQAVHGVARRSALTATLISRLVPLAATDQARLSEAAELRGPGATPVGCRRQPSCAVPEPLRSARSRWRTGCFPAHWTGRLTSRRLLSFAAMRRVPAGRSSRRLPRDTTPGSGRSARFSPWRH